MNQALYKATVVEYPIPGFKPPIPFPFPHSNPHKHALDKEQ